MNSNKGSIARRMFVKGLVQGVGFRPFVFVLAQRYELKGWVENRNDGVVIQVEGKAEVIEEFSEALKKEKPLPAKINSIVSEVINQEDCKEFIIRKSTSMSEEVTEISPDICVCDACLNDMDNQEHRKNYPFINCTNCGPRFTIIKDLPYDREMTTMQPFVMCDKCSKEYKDVYDRRFHAQPVACNQCGPSYVMHLKNMEIHNLDLILSKTAEIIESKGVMAIKGLGGYHLCCDALSEEAVSRLRKSKMREGKPFAIMFRDQEAANSYTLINNNEKEVLLSWQKPIVLLQIKNELAFSVSNGLNTVGVMLPYMPFHHLLFHRLSTPALVMTSGNLSEEPIVINDDFAKVTFLERCDAVITYNREIFNRTDDSVVFSVNKKTHMIRRSRGYVPSPVLLDFNIEGVFAAGAELVNTFGIGKGKQAILSQHIGDLKNYETFEFYEESVERFRRMFRFSPRLVVCDLHPDYLSTRFAQSLSLPKVYVQHHHAHIASVMAEHHINEDVIGVAMDGVGLGTDGHIWGGEFLLCNYRDFQRIMHFEYIPQPGGDKVTQEPWRMAVSYLYHYFGEDLFSFNLPFIQAIGESRIREIISLLKLRINCPLTSSAGRLFDAVSALALVCPVSTFHAEAPMRLESVMNGSCKEAYDFNIAETISFKAMFSQILNDIENNVSSSAISSRFHNTVNNAIFEGVVQISKQTGIKKVALSGGSFQNRYILSHVEKRLFEKGLHVFTNELIPSNDGGIALGQLAIGASNLPD